MSASSPALRHQNESACAAARARCLQRSCAAPRKLVKLIAEQPQPARRAGIRVAQLLSQLHEHSPG